MPLVIRWLPLALPLLLALAGCGGSSNESASSTTTTTPTTTDAAGCVPVSHPPSKEGSEKKPTSKLDPSKTYDVAINTNCGDFTIRLAVKTSPNTTASFASLVDKGFYDDTVFHRIVPGFVIQGGDPTGTGSGGPGYSTVDRPAPGTRYTHGVVAMAKTAAEPPGTGGSQFFVVTAADAQLPPDYAVLGKVVKGLDVVDKIGKQGDQATGGEGLPTETVVIQKATLTTH
jgi:peptidyl-prolyl cis-trans isomerase B (cyclophilin B)